MSLITINNDSVKHNLCPFSLTRSVPDIRIGIFTLREKWKLFGYEIETDNRAESLPANIIPSCQILDDLKKNNFQSILSAAKKIEYPWDIFRLNDEMLRQDFSIIAKDRKSNQI